MHSWSKVKWTDARQVVDAMDQPEDDPRPDTKIDPRSYFTERRRAGDLKFAVAFIGHALPRYEAVAWAALQLERYAARIPPKPRDRETLDRALRWLDDASDEQRRATMAAAENAGTTSAERLLGMAVFFSGGSIAPPELEPILPPESSCGRFAALAVTAAAYRVPDPRAALDEALELGEQIAGAGVPSSRAG